MTWWCAATDLPWSWTWRAYPGVWLFVFALAAAYLAWGRPADAARGERRRAAAYFAGGLVLVWAALDWPLGTLGGGYLASAHALQYVLLSLAAPPLLLIGLSPAVARRPGDGTRAARGLRLVAHPMVGLAGYNLILFVTHFPGVVDGLMATQVGAFAIDVLWILAGALLWWPVLAPERFARISAPLRMGYLFLQTIPATLPAAFLTFAQYPLYSLYELAPRASAALTPGYDQQVAGLIMKIVGDPVVWLGIAVIFFRWATAERRADLEAQRRLPDPRVRT